jgi:putative redox protein
MKARVKWTEGNQYIGEADDSHIVIMEASTFKTSAGPSPMEMLLMGMGACASSDVVSILLKMRQNVDDVTVEMEASRADSIPRVFTNIHVAFTVTGRSVSLSKAKEAERLSGEIYCSAPRILEKSAQITFETKVIEAP